MAVFDVSFLSIMLLLLQHHHGMAMARGKGGCRSVLLLPVGNAAAGRMARYRVVCEAKGQKEQKHTVRQQMQSNTSIKHRPAVPPYHAP